MFSNLSTQDCPPLTTDNADQAPSVEEDPLAYYERMRESKRRKKEPVTELQPIQEFEDVGDKRPITYQVGGVVITLATNPVYARSPAIKD